MKNFFTEKPKNSTIQKPKKRKRRRRKSAPEVQPSKPPNLNELFFDLTQFGKWYCQGLEVDMKIEDIKNEFLHKMKQLSSPMKTKCGKIFQQGAYYPGQYTDISKFKKCPVCFKSNKI